MATGWQIFISFLKIGAMLFGGGYAMLPLLEREVVNRRAWCGQEEMTDFYAMAQLVPGVIAVNTAMLIGHRLRGFFGTLMATLGVVCVPFLIILAYGIVFDTIADHSVLNRAMAGLRPAVAGMMLGTAWTLFRRTGQTRLGVSVIIAVLAASLLFKINAVALILAGVVGGILWWLITCRRLKGGDAA
ncbi:MAG: chromate transporter [Kiritimatiellae bacterium]|nr:chromate transporter [Kiritimatiellia bacterium]